MPVFDFKNASNENQEFVCTYTTFNNQITMLQHQSSQYLYLDNKKHTVGNYHQVGNVY